MVAAQEGRASEAQLLLRAGANVEVRTLNVICCVTYQVFGYTRESEYHPMHEDAHGALSSFCTRDAAHEAAAGGFCRNSKPKTTRQGNSIASSFVFASWAALLLSHFLEPSP